MYCSKKNCHKEIANVEDNEEGLCKDHLAEKNIKAEQLRRALKNCEKCGKRFDQKFIYCPYDATELKLNLEPIKIK